MKKNMSVSISGEKMTDLKDDYKKVTDPDIWTGLDEDEPGELPKEPEPKEPEAFETKSVTFVIYEGDGKLYADGIRNEL